MEKIIVRFRLRRGKKLGQLMMARGRPDGRTDGRRQSVSSLPPAHAGARRQKSRGRRQQHPFPFFLSAFLLPSFLPLQLCLRFALPWEGEQRRISHIMGFVSGRADRGRKEGRSGGLHAPLICILQGCPSASEPETLLRALLHIF